MEIGMTDDDLKQRTKQFALRVLKLVDALPKSRAGGIVAGQLIRCGTSVGSNYRAACRARSRAEFVAKLGTVEEEADESAFWMEVIVDDGMKVERLVRALRTEAEQLTRIIVASIVTARPRKPISNPQSKIQNP